MEKIDHTFDGVQRTAEKARNFVSWHMAVELKGRMLTSAIRCRIDLFHNFIHQEKSSVVLEVKWRTVILKSRSMNIAVHQHPGLEYQGVLLSLCVDEEESPPK